MDVATRDVETGKRCARCDTVADAGLIFCRECGAALQPPAPLMPPCTQALEGSSDTLSLPKRALVLGLKGLAGIAAVVAVFCPLSTFGQIGLFVGSVVVALVCYAVLSNLNETHIEEYAKDGFWPPKPIDWNASSGTRDSADEGATQPKL